VYVVKGFQDTDNITNESLLALFDQLATLIQGHIACNKPLNIHTNCNHGRNRSVTFLLFLFMKLYNMSPPEAFLCVQTAYQQKYGEIGSLPPGFMASKGHGLLGVKFLDWYANKKQTLHSSQQHEERSSRSQPQSFLAAAVKKGSRNPKQGYICNVPLLLAEHEGDLALSFFVSDLKGARNLISSPSEVLGNSHSLVSVDLSGKGTTNLQIYDVAYQSITTLVSKHGGWVVT
jgi:hypothetical protein